MKVGLTIGIQVIVGQIFVYKTYLQASIGSSHFARSIKYNDKLQSTTSFVHSSSNKTDSEHFNSKRFELQQRLVLRTILKPLIRLDSNVPIDIVSS